MYKKISVNVIIVKNNKRKRIYTAQEMKKSIIENFIFCAVLQLYRNLQKFYNLQK